MGRAGADRSGARVGRAVRVKRAAGGPTSKVEAECGRANHSKGEAELGQAYQ